jgi:hypothetical protein
MIRKTPSQFARVTAGLAVVALMLALHVSYAAARTIILEGDKINAAASLDALAPRQGMSFSQAWGQVRINSQIYLAQSRNMLVRFSLDDIPPKHRIAYAELVLNITSFSGTEPRFYLWRMVADWGVGACHDYRMIDGDKKTEWARKGAGNVGIDRAARPTDVVRFTENGEVIINVTGDVELWHRGAAPNNGWLLSVEDPGVALTFRSPLWDGQPDWRLRVTYEPE